MRWIGIFFIMIFYYSSVLGSSNDSNATKSKRSITDIISGKVKFIIPQKPAALNVDKTTNEKYQKSLQAYYDYKIRGFEHRSRVFEWQLYSSKLLFAVVLVLVFSGVVLSCLQFYAGFKEKQKESQKSVSNSEFSFSTEGIKISSPVIGLLILALSLGFFYLYLVYIFPIEELF